jgi:signal transduction histidine kinase/CheY-like chemotaxis protein
MTDYTSIQEKIRFLESRLTEPIGEEERIDCMNEIAGELFVYDVDRAQSYTRLARKIATAVGYKKGVATSLNKEALCCRIRSDFKRSIQLSREALGIFESLGDKSGQAESLNNIAFMEVNMDDFKNALQNILRSIVLAQEGGNKSIESFASLVLGMIYEGLGDYPQALVQHLKALALSREDGNRGNEGAALINLGIVFRKIGEGEKAKEHFESAYEIFKAMETKLMEAASLYNLGTSYRDTGDYNKALDYLSSSLRLQKEIGHASGQGACYISIGYILQKLKKFHEAEENIRESIELARAFGKKNYECNGMLALGECQLEQHREREAIALLEEAKSEAEVYAGKDVRQRIMQALSRGYEAKGDHRKALSYFKEAIAIRNELINEESTRKNKGLMIIHEVETVKREREIALREKEKAEQSERFKEQFLANMSHEIRTPMNAIVGLADLIARTKLNPLQIKYVSAIRQSADNLLGIIQDILDFSKIESGQIELEEINFSIYESLEAVYSTLRYKADDKKITLSFEIDERIPGLVCGDPVRLKQILINLVGNAIKFTETGGITISARLENNRNEQITICFSVTDTGIGIPENKLGDIFKSFVQASSSTTRKYGGTGLGLSISKQLVEMQHGHIEVRSTIGHGTTFSFFIPYKPFSPSIEEEKKETPAMEGWVNELLSDGKFKVLLVEDNRFNQMVAVDSLQSFIPEVLVELAENGKIALQKLDADMFHIMLLDLQMPEMDGYETTDFVRNKLQAPQRDIPIIALTANATKTEKDKCLKAGMNGYLSKPFQPIDLIQQIRSVMTEN